MNFSDILALAKQGYKPSDIKELMAIPTDDKSLASGEPSDKDKEVDAPISPEASAPKSDDPKPEDKKANPIEDELAALKEELNKTKEALAKAQEANKREPISAPSKGNEIEDIVRKFM